MSHVDYYDDARDWLLDYYEAVHGGGRMPQWTDAEVERLAAEHYAGGWAQFIADGA